MGTLGKIIGVLFAVVGLCIAVVVVGLVVASSNRQGSAPSGARPSHHHPLQEIVDAEWVIGAHSAHWEEFTISDPVTVRAEVHGERNADKGVRVRLVDADDVQSCQVAGGTCRGLPSWSQLQSVGFSEHGIVPAGRWAFLVENNENLFRSATVRVHLVAGGD